MKREKSRMSRADSLKKKDDKKSIGGFSKKIWFKTTKSFMEDERISLKFASFV